MTETGAINLAVDPSFLKRVAFSLAKNAKVIHAESAGPRTVLASKIAFSPMSYAPGFAAVALASLSAGALAAIAQPDGSDVAQASIDTQVLAVWDTFTG